MPINKVEELEKFKQIALGLYGDAINVQIDTDNKRLTLNLYDSRHVRDALFEQYNNVTLLPNDIGSTAITDDGKGIIVLQDFDITKDKEKYRLSKNNQLDVYLFENGKELIQFIRTDTKLNKYFSKFTNFNPNSLEAKDLEILQNIVSREQDDRDLYSKATSKIRDIVSSFRQDTPKPHKNRP